jgi:drug/metabolite transporter (DMT)-like permease
MFIGEFCCIIAFTLRKACSKKIEEVDEDRIPLSPGTQMAKTTKLKTSINPLYLLVPATCDICGSTLMFIALT